MAKVLGTSAVLVIGVAAFPLMAWVMVQSTAPAWLILIAILAYSPVLLAIAWRVATGGEQGAADLVINETRDSRSIVLGNIPLKAVAQQFSQGLYEYGRLPRYAGTIQGNPADPKSIKALDEPTSTTAADGTSTVARDAEGMGEQPKAEGLSPDRD